MRKNRDKKVLIASLLLFKELIMFNNLFSLWFSRLLKNIYKARSTSPRRAIVPNQIKILTISTPASLNMSSNILSAIGGINALK